MKVAEAPFKRLRFEYDPGPRESVIGALAAACREHRLPRIATALEGGGVHVARIGLIQCAPTDMLDRIARVIRTEPEAVIYGYVEQRDVEIVLLVGRVICLFVSDLVYFFVFCCF